jgi:hypothetical protein
MENLKESTIEQFSSLKEFVLAVDQVKAMAYRFLEVPITIDQNGVYINGESTCIFKDSVRNNIGEIEKWHG